MYHDESFGFRRPREFVFPDYTDTQLVNRHQNAALLRYVDSMRTHGHRAARIDPLDLIQREEVAALDPARYGLTDENQKYNVDGIIWTKPSVYVGRIAHEYMHSPSKTERLWFSHLLESEPSVPSVVGSSEKRRIHELLAKSEVFDNFLQLKFPNLKRYGLEGGESMLPALDSYFLSHLKASLARLTMPHRGRLNLLTGLLGYSPTASFTKLKDMGAEGDVLSHLVASPSLDYGSDSSIKVSLLPNPSHLEAVNPVALGKTRAKQYSLLKTSPDDCKLGDKVMCVQLHGDASFTGQGIVMEGLGLSKWARLCDFYYIDIISIGYTTPASGARSSFYCSDVGKMINAPVLHVNGDHPEDVVRAMNIAFRYRNYFRKDIIVDLLVYRRCHNELDIPDITSPLMYKKITARRSVPQQYEDKLISENVLDDKEISGLRTSYKSHLNSELAQVDSYDQWNGLVWPASKEANHTPETGVDRDTLVKVGKASIAVPPGFEIHSKLHRHIKNRMQSIDSGRGVDWASAEAMAFGSLMLEGCDVRISGQDVGRGTFSQRHAMLVNQKSEGVIVPLNDELAAQGKLELANSSLSEMAVLGFEYGASWENPNLLPIWEAQFGDFFNGAQVILSLDPLYYNLLKNCPAKWLRQSGLTLLLPHGLDGAGPEHSSSRLERMLQLTNDPFTNEGPANINMHVVFPTTPAQYFHLLRRQMKRNFRKPLVVASPKGLLRLSAASSTLADMEPGTSFQPVLSDPLANEMTVERVVILSGKIYYELIKERQARGLDERVAFVRIEELAPFPFSHLEKVLATYNSHAEFVYLQEEPRNQGAYTHLGYTPVVKYLGRKESALPAPGIGKLYAEQQREVIEQAFRGL
ncbi:dehydrogenase E1 and transketolase domain-containing protein 1 [Infundibulicybe gibba]|nr:dehydrogenase E1 and transketolase domain-containing protein 1 [Infundibulicybe gibba]